MGTKEMWGAYSTSVFLAWIRYRGGRTPFATLTASSSSGGEQLVETRLFYIRGEKVSADWACRGELPPIERAVWKSCGRQSPEGIGWPG